MHEIVCQRKDNGRLVPVARVKMTGNTDLEIVTAFDAELRGLCNYYSLASNYRSLNFFSYLMEYSCLKTLAWKHRCKLSKIYDMYRTGEKRWGVGHGNAGRFAECRRVAADGSSRTGCPQDAGRRIFCGCVDAPCRADRPACRASGACLLERTPPRHPRQC